MRLKQPMIAELDRNELARIFQDNYFSCKILQDSHRLARSCQITIFLQDRAKKNHFLQKSWKILQDKHLVLTREANVAHFLAVYLVTPDCNKSRKKISTIVLIFKIVTIT